MEEKINNHLTFLFIEKKNKKNLMQIPKNDVLKNFYKRFPSI